MEFLRVFTNPKRCMQRLGFLKPLIWRASQSATNNLSTLGTELISGVSHKVTVTLTAELQDYIKTAVTEAISKTARATASMLIQPEHEKPKVQLELQDVYLAATDLPSRRGRLVNEDWNKYPYLALNLGLLRKASYSLLVRGQSFLSLLKDNERKAFGRPAPTMIDQASDPLRLSMPQRLLLLFSFIEGDGDVLRHLYQRLLPIPEPIVDREAGAYLPQIYRSIVKESRSKARSGDDLLRIQRLLDTSDKIERWIGRKPTGSKDILMQSITPRLEPFIDLGLLAKTDPFSYRYQITDVTKSFFLPLIDAAGPDYFLHRNFFAVSNDAYHLNAQSQLDDKSMLAAIWRAYTVLKSPLGYAPILEVSLLAGIYSITEASTYFEVSQCIERLKLLQKERPDIVRFNVDRWGHVTFVKFLANPLGG